MNFFKNMSIRGKIISILLMFCILETAIALVGINFLHMINTNLNHIVAVETVRIKLAERLNSNLLEIHRAEKNLILSHTQEDIELFSRNISQFKHDLKASMDKKAMLTGEQGLLLLKKFKTDYDKFIEINSEVQSLVRKTIECDFGRPGESSVALKYHNPMAIGLSQGKGREAYNQAAQSVKAMLDRTRVLLDLKKTSSNTNSRLAMTIMIVLAVISITIGLILGLRVVHLISAALAGITGVADAIAAGDLEKPIVVKSGDVIGKLAASISRMQAVLRKARDESAARNWLKTGIMRLNEVMCGELSIAELSSRVISEVATCLDAQVGAFYLLESREKEPVFTRVSGYAFSQCGHLPDQFKPGEGLVGQAAQKKQPIYVHDLPEDYLKVISGLGEAKARFISVIPLLNKEQINGVIEIGGFKPVTPLQLEYLELVMPAIAIHLETSWNREQLAQVLEKSQALAGELQSQQEELKTFNEELEEQTQALLNSENKLQSRQKELQIANEELGQKNQSLSEQKYELEQAKLEIEEKADELAITSKYKSEFLSNMSHELRTPLTSLLLLAENLADNKAGNLTKTQAESAEIIYNSGNDLLFLINDILDLAKIEAGRMDVHCEEILLQDVAKRMQTGFQSLADDKGLQLDISIDKNAPREIFSDWKWFERIIKNLLSNAIKFTEKGQVVLHFSRPARDVNLSQSGLDVGNTIAITVSDTGIGISPEKHKNIFESFQQAEGGTSRKYGGTGLGLSIARESAKLLGGEIQLTSKSGAGSTFILYLPLKAEVPGKSSSETQMPKQDVNHQDVPNITLPAGNPIPDDRERLQENDKTILIINDDDRDLLKLLRSRSQQKGFKCLVSASGEDGLALAEKYLPLAIILDIKLPGIDGWTVLKALKDMPATRHIPVQLMSVEETAIDVFKKGAIGCLKKPINQEELETAFRKLEEIFSRKISDLLVVEDNAVLRKSIIKLVGNRDVRAGEASSGQEAIRALKSKNYACVILDLGLPDMTGFELLKLLQAQADTVIPPVIVYTGRDLTREEETELQNFAQSIIIKGVKSEERLLDETSLFLHRKIDKLPETKRKIITNLYDPDIIFKDKKVLLVEDDMRNVFALANVLGKSGLKLFKAGNGQKALEILDREPDLDLVLLDIMMPVMDGYEVMKRIRAQEKFRKLPIIAITAKAMKEDREHCLAAGASDYLPKPVDVKRLCAMMRTWMYR